MFDNTYVLFIYFFSYYANPSDSFDEKDFYFSRCLYELHPGKVEIASWAFSKIDEFETSRRRLQTTSEGGEERKVKRGISAKG